MAPTSNPAHLLYSMLYLSFSRILSSSLRDFINKVGWLESFPMRPAALLEPADAFKSSVLEICLLSP